MSFIHGDGITHLSDYENNPKDEKEVLRLFELLGTKLEEVWDIIIELRYFALYIDFHWKTEKSFEHCGLFGDIHHNLRGIIENYFWKKDTLYRYLTTFENKYCFKKLKPEVIEFIKETLDKDLEKLRERGY